MRRTLTSAAALVVLGILISVFIPLAVVLRSIGEERALSRATRHTIALVAVLAGTTSHTEITAQIDVLERTDPHDLTVHLPETSLGGAGRASPGHLADAVRHPHETVVPLPDGLALLQPVITDRGVTVIEVYVPEALVEEHVVTAFAWFAVVALGMAVVAVAVADRLVLQIVRAARDLALASRRFGGGNRAVRIVPRGPSELAEAGRNFNVMAEQISALLAAERELAADLSHRLRTPLAALRLEVGHLAECAEVDRVLRSVANLTATLDSVIDEARTPIEVRLLPRCDLGAVVRERLRYWAPLAEDDGRRWTMRAVTGPVPVPVWHSDMAAVIDALIGNVFQHTPPGVPYSVAVRVDGPSTVLTIADGGPGITDQDRAVLRGVSGSGSTGLGLDIAAKTAERCGGSLSVGRSPAGGALIEILLPLSARP